MEKKSCRGTGDLPFYIALFSLSILSTKLQHSLASVISPNTALTPSSSSLWTSPHGTFSMGFFSLLPSTYYVGIWYSSLPINQSIIWTANRSQSVPANSTLRFTHDGQLLLYSNSSLIIWAADPGNAASQAELLDTGNFVLRDNTSNVIWQSFDHPTDTLLPSQNFTFSSNPSLVPWTSTSDPSPSTKYSLVFGRTAGPIGHIRLVYQNVGEYWSEPPLEITTALYNTAITIDGTGTLSLINGDGSVVWFNLSCDGTKASTSFTKLQLSVDGNLRVLTWSSDSRTWDTQWRALYLQCDVFGTCGDNGICNKNQNSLSVGGGGCPLPEAQSICSCPEGFTRKDSSCTPPSSLNCSQYMSTMEHTSFGVPRLQASFGLVSQQDCEGKCLSDCNCTGASYNKSSSECWLYRTTLFNGVISNSTDKASFIKTVSTNSTGGTNPYYSGLPGPYAIALIAVAASCILLLFISGLFIRHQIRSRFPSFKDVVLDRDVLNAIGGPNRFSFEDLYMVTHGFNEENKLGAGGFGTVYKGTFTTPDNGKLDVAIKRLDKFLRQGYEQEHGKEDKHFLAEIEILGSIKHLNVVHLMGFCAQGPERLLVYEYIANGSLRNHILSELNILSWDMRFQIAVGAATGIEYLHAHCPKKIVHRDIKPDNILIDEDFKAKVADFGISQILGPERTHLTNNTPHGTPTYMAPECWQVGALVTEKADAYSYGVVLLELVSGRMVSKEKYEAEEEERGEEGEQDRMIEKQDKKKRRKLPLDKAIDLMEKGRWESLVDERLEGAYNREDAERLVKIVFWCLQGKPNQRPYMEDLLLMIKGHIHVPPPPLLGLLDLGIVSSSQSSSSLGTTSHPLPEDLSQGR